jgi:hypothetical protein
MPNPAKFGIGFVLILVIIGAGAGVLNKAASLA